jgi:hypothetical protein
MPVVAAYILALAVFALDMVEPLSSGISFYYLVPVAFLALWSSPKQAFAVGGIAAVCSMLIGVELLLSSPDDFWSAVSRRGNTLIVIGVLVMLSVVRKRAEEEVKALHGLLPICSYCKKIRDHQGYWQQVERYIAARTEADFTHGLCPDCGSKHFPDMVADPSRKASLGFFGQPEC